jgi:hypothetical protein
MDMEMLVTALLAIPFILIIAGTVFQTFSFQSRVTFEETVTGEELGVVDVSPKTFTTDYPVKKGSEVLTVKNVTSGEVISSSISSIDYKSGLDPADVTVESLVTGADIKAYLDYTAYKAEGYDDWKKTYYGTFSGMKLGSILPYIYIAIAIVTIIIGAFGVSRFI